ncbi:glutaredoxin 2 isoform X1 [Epinephelus lanceolatus]
MFSCANQILHRLFSWLVLDDLAVGDAGWCSYMWSEVVRPVGCIATLRETTLETVYGGEMNILFTGNSSGPYLRKPAQQTLSLIPISELTESELGISEFSVPEQMIRISSINSEYVHPEGSAFTVSTKSHHQWSADDMTFNGRKRRMGNFTSATSLSSTSCAQYVQEVVSQNCVVIFSKTTCPYCKMAKNVFNEIGATYKVIELDEHNDGRRLQEALAQMTGARTVPRVFINGNCIGGGSDTKQLHQQGKLLPLIEQCATCCAGTSADGSGSGQFASAK